MAAVGLLAAFAGRLWFGVGGGNAGDSAVYGYLVVTLLAIGLYASTSGVSNKELRRNRRTVLLAITVGVVVKAAIIGSVIALLHQDARYLILGVCVAQIDPLSVAAMRHQWKLSARARTVLVAWASFDDPITVLLTVYLSTVVLRSAVAAGGPAHGLVVGGGILGLVVSLLRNAVLVAAVGGVRWFLDQVGGAGSATERYRTPIDSVVLAAAATVAVWLNLLLGLAVIGLFLRPLLDRLVDRLARLAFYLATFLLGALLVHGVDLVSGLVLGCTAFVAQVLVGLVLTWNMARSDRIRIALGQQNGITAIILALTIQPYFQPTVGIVAVAVLTTNLLNIVTNRWRSATEGKIAVNPEPRPTKPISLTSRVEVSE